MNWEQRARDLEKEAEDMKYIIDSRDEIIEDLEQKLIEANEKLKVHLPTVILPSCENCGAKMTKVLVCSNLKCSNSE